MPRTLTALILLLQALQIDMLIKGLNAESNLFGIVGPEGTVDLVDQRCGGKGVGLNRENG